MTIMGSIASMAGLTEQVIATDFLVSAKSAIQNYAIAITEVTSTDLRRTLKKQLNDALDTHEAIFSYMTDKGYYHPYDLLSQHKEDLKVTDTALELFEARD